MDSRWDKSFLSCCVLLFALAIPTNGATQEPREVLAGIPRSWPPQYSLDDNGNPTGFAIDIMEEIAARAGLRVGYRIMDSFAEVSEAMNAGQIDLIPNSGITPDRAAKFAFTSPVETFVVSIFVREGAPKLRGADDLRGQKVGVVEFNIGQRLMQDRDDLELVVYRDAETALFSLVAGHTDAMVFPQPVLLNLARQVGIADRIEVVGPPLREVKRGIRVQLGETELLAALNQAVNEFVGTPAYQAIYLKWYGAAKPFWTVSRVIVAMGALALFVLIAMVWWRYHSLVNLNRGLRDSISARKRAEEALREREALLTHAQDVAKVGYWVWYGENISDWDLAGTSSGKKPILSDQFRDIFGITEGQDRVVTWQTHPDDSPQFREVFRKAEESHEAYRLEYRIVGDDGDIRFVREFGEPKLDPETGQWIWLGVVQDITESKQAEKALRENEERFRTVVNFSPTKIHIKDLEGRYLLINKEAEELFGVSDEDARAKTSADIFPQERAKAFEENDRAVIEAGRPIEFEEEWVRDDGVHTYLTVKFPISDVSGKVVAVGAIGTDITSRNRVAVALRNSELRYKNLFSSAEISIWNEDFTEVCEVLYQLRRNGVSDLRQYLGENEQAAWNMAAMVKVNDVNRATLKLFKAKSEKDFIESINKTFAPDAIDVFINELCAIWEKESVFRSEATFLTLDGEKITAIISMPIPDTDEGFRNIPVSILDITKRKQLEDRLNEAARIAKLGHWIWDEVNDRIIDCSEGFARIYGLTTKEILASDIGELNPLFAHPDDVDWLQKVYNEYRDNPKVYDIEYRINRPDGSSLYLHTIGTPILNEKGQVVRTFGITQDITELKRAEEQLRQSQKMEAVGQLTAGVAHDFNNLLAVIWGNAELLGDELGADNPRLAAVFRTTKRAADLTQHLLAFSRKQVLNPEIINTNNLIVDITGLLRRTLEEHIEIETVTAAGLWNCEVDPAQLENALVNLALNARDAMPEGGKLTIETANVRIDDDYAAAQVEVTPGQYVMLAVTDSGSGMPPEVREHAFEPFFTTKAVGTGSGLGLSMIYGFVKQSGGHVTIYSEEGEGTTIKLYLPRSTETVAAEKKPATGEAPIARGENVLVVEDDPELRTLAVALLSNLGYQVMEAGTAAAALEQLETTARVNLLLTDVVLPGGMNGPELAAEVKRRAPGIQVLYMSGYTEDAIVRHGRLDADAELLQKPFGRADLARAVRRVLDGPSA